MNEPREQRDLTDEWNRQIDELFQIEHAFPAEWAPDDAKPRPSILRRVRDWVARGFGFSTLPVASEQDDGRG